MKKRRPFLQSVMCIFQLWLIFSSTLNLSLVVYLYRVTSTWRLEKASLERSVERLEQDNRDLVREVHRQEALHRSYVESLATIQEEEIKTEEVQEAKILVPIDIEWSSFYLSMLVFILINIGLFLCNRLQQ